MLLIFFQSWSKADDVSEFEIEGMSIGDSALDFVKKDYLLAQKKIGLKVYSSRYGFKFFKYIRCITNCFIAQMMINLGLRVSKLLKNEKNIQQLIKV